MNIPYHEHRDTDMLNAWNILRQEYPCAEREIAGYACLSNHTHKEAESRDFCQMRKKEQFSEILALRDGILPPSKLHLDKVFIHRN